MLHGVCSIQIDKEQVLEASLDGISQPQASQESNSCCRLYASRIIINLYNEKYQLGGSTDACNPEY